ncbi:conserved hypothetical protein [Roseovarius sp. EC-HK134]|uniref:plasmid mobilization protein n=1 Tax=unclassified Roseovarius TaxID=2614913 RepID=UPI001259B984|nr:MULTISPECIES: plasmid mobilization relaxosome protein MobC [unclassified Roseovarius]VVS96217.1 conserved hypothetical protein [Roseovarius sp. EC-SD190]VVS96240.1 conserved hypothetical protein [Roseovarius sp. EC-HK134]
MAKAGDGKERSDKRKRGNILQKRVNDGELAAFIERAHEAGFPDHRDYLAALIFGEAGFDRRERQDLIKIIGELGKHGSNLNQIAHGINSGKVSALSADDIKTIEAARAAVDDAATMLKGALK